MNRMNYLAVTLFILVSVGIVTAQEDSEELPKVEVFGGYSLLRSESENFHG